MNSMSTKGSKIQVAPETREAERCEEVRSLGREAAALSLTALRLSRLAAELARSGDAKHEAA